MNEDNLNPFRTIKTLLRDNRGFISINRSPEGGEGGGGEGEGEGEGEGGGVATLDWRAGLSPDIKEHPALKNFKTPADVAKSYINAQQLIGKKGVPLPSKESDPLDDTKRKDWDTVYDTLGRPSDPKTYEIPKVEVPQGFPPIPEKTVNDFKAFAHKIGLLPHQVKALYQWQHEQAVNGFSEHGKAMEASLQESEGVLRKEYGKAFDGNLAAAKGLLKKFGDDKVIAALEASGIGNNPDMIRFMVKIAKQFGEDGKVLVGETQPNILSPQEAQAEVDKIMADKNGAYWNKPDAKGNKPFSDGEHKAMVKKVQDLMEMAHPSKKEG